MQIGFLKLSAIVAVLAVAGGATYYYSNHKTATASIAANAGKGDKGGKDVAKSGDPKGGQGKGGAGKGGGRPVPVVLATVEKRDVPITLNAVGRAEAFSTVSLRSRLDGQVLAVDIQPGQFVKKGQALFRLDSGPADAQFRQAQGNLLRDQAQLAKAKADLDRYSDLARKGFVSPSAVDGYRSAVEALEGTVKLGQAAVDFAKLQFDFTTVRAPMDGVAGAILVFPGGNVKANDTVVVVLNQMQPIYVSFAIPESQLDGVRVLQKKGPIRVQVETRDGSRTQLATRLVFIDNTIDTSTGTITLKAAYPNADLRLTPGQFVDVKLVTRVLTDAIAMPIEAMQMSPNGNIVFVATADNKVEIRPVKQSMPAGAMVVVPEGFQAGERVVIDGQLRLFPGASIEARTPGGGAVKGGAAKAAGADKSGTGEGAGRAGTGEGAGRAGTGEGAGKAGVGEKSGAKS